MKVRDAMIAGGAVCLIAAGLQPARADIYTTGNLFVTDYGQSELFRYAYTFDQTTKTITAITPDGIGNNKSNAYFLGSASDPVKEGIHGTANDLIVVGGTHGSGVTTISRYTLDGTFIGAIPIDFSAYNNGTVGIGNVLVTSDGNYMYAPLETAGYVVKVDLANGKIVSSFQFAGAHDVAIAANGDVYVSNYNAANASVIVLDANLTAGSKHTLITAAGSGVSGSFRPSGLTVASDGTLYVNNNIRGGPDSLLHYDIAGKGAGLTATLDKATSYIGSATNNALEFTFGNNVGPDGLVYIAALGGGGSGSFSVTKGYADGIYAFNPVTDAMALAIRGYTETSGPKGPSGLDAPKYLQFDTNFVTAPDAGYTAIPEPGSAAVLLAAISGAAIAKRRGRRARLA